MIETEAKTGNKEPFLTFHKPFELTVLTGENGPDLEEVLSRETFNVCGDLGNSGETQQVDVMGFRDGRRWWWCMYEADNRRADMGHYVFWTQWFLKVRKMCPASQCKGQELGQLDFDVTAEVRVANRDDALRILCAAHKVSLQVREKNVKRTIAVGLQQANCD